MNMTATVPEKEKWPHYINLFFFVHGKDGAPSTLSIWRWALHQQPEHLLVGVASAT